MQTTEMPRVEASSVAAHAVEAARSSAARASAPELFGSFMLGEAEFALPAACIGEVVNFPDKVTAIPLSPPFLDGVFTLRGTVIPIINLARIFDPAAAGSSRQHKVAIIEHDNIHVGIVFDNTGEVLRVRPEQRSVLQYAQGQDFGVIGGTIALDEGARLLEILNPSALVHIENVPQVQALRANSRQADKSHFHLQADRRQGVSFRVGGTQFAFQMGAIREIINVPELKASVMASPLCLGRITFRGSAVAVIDFAALLQIAPGSSRGGASATERIIIARVGETQLGFLVDSVDDIFHFFDNDVMPIPLLSKARVRMFAGCIAREGRGDVLFLDHESILSGAELAEISIGHTRLYQQEASEEQDKVVAATKARHVYIVFSLDTPWAVDIRDVREIVPYSADMVAPPGLPACVRGIMNLRQQMITVIDARALFGLDRLADLSAAKVLVIEHGEERYGLVVDAVENIITVPDSARRTSPRLGAEHVRGHMGEAGQVIDIVGAASTTTVAVLLRDELLALVESEMQKA